MQDKWPGNTTILCDFCKGKEVNFVDGLLESKLGKGCWFWRKNMIVPFLVIEEKNHHSANVKEVTLAVHDKGHSPFYEDFCTVPNKLRFLTPASWPLPTIACHARAMAYCIHGLHHDFALLQEGQIKNPHVAKRPISKWLEKWNVSME